MKHLFRLFSVCIMIHVSTCLNAKDKEPEYPVERIYYTISDLTEYNIYNFIKDHCADRKDCICIFIGFSAKVGEGHPYVLLIVPDTPGDYASFLKTSTNRYVMINKESYPVIFDFDFIYAYGDVTSEYVKYQPLTDGSGYEFTFPGESKVFEDISMWGIDVSGYTLDYE